MAPENEVFVRPFGYDAGVPMIRQIGDRELYLGNGHAVNDDETLFEHVLSLTAEPNSASTHHRPLVDGDGNDWAAFERAVDTAWELLGRDGSTLVHCKHGISRSSAVIATAIAAEEAITFREALDVVHDVWPHAVPHPRLHEQAIVYLTSRSGAGVEKS